MSIHHLWAGVPRAYHGLMVPGFPNFFMMYGPNTNQGGNSILIILEAQARFIAAALESMREHDASRVEVTATAMERYVTELEAALATTVWQHGCNSYFRTAGGNVVTQLPHTSRWYETSTARLALDDIQVSRPKRHCSVASQVRQADLHGS